MQERRDKNTWTKTRRDVSLLSDVLKLKEETRKAEEIKQDVCELILNVKRTDGEDYEPSTSSRSLEIQSLKEGKYPVSIIDDKEFYQARKCLEARRKQL